MFTGIIEDIGVVTELTREQSNITFTIKSTIAPFLGEDESVSHNGVCLTVVAVNDSTKEYTVTAVKETLEKTNLNSLKKGSKVNIERAMEAGSRLDGHIVQGHVDTTGKCISKINEEGSTVFRFRYAVSDGYFTVPKGSVTVNGASLTVIDSIEGEFSVTIIPYTMEHTTFHELNEGDTVNLEFDIIGKYISHLVKPYLKAL